jgi:hypothetical protein
LYTGPSLLPLLANTAKNLEKVNFDPFLSNEFSLGEYGIEKSEWIQKSQEMLEFQDQYVDFD